MQTGLSEQCKQSDGLQGDRFSSGIWSGDHEHREILSDADIDRDDLFRIKQWMAALFDSDAPFFIEIRFASLIVERELSTCKDEIQLRHEQDIVIDRVAVDSYLPAQIGEYDLNLFFFFDLQLTQIIVQLYDSHWFDEECGSGRGLIVDHAGYL